MLRTFKNVLKDSRRNFYFTKSCGCSDKKSSIFNKSLKLGLVTIPDLVEITKEGENKLNHIKLLQGRFPYLPLDDHPLIPGYARILNLSKDIYDKLKEIDVEKKLLVISVMKNPKEIEALQLSTQQMQMNMNFVPNIKSKDEVYAFGCICEVKLKEEKNFEV